MPTGPHDRLWAALRAALGEHPPAGGVLDVSVPARAPRVRLSIRHEPGYRSEHLWSRLLCPVAPEDGFRVGIYPQPWYEEVAERFGLQDVHVGDDRFDRHFRVRSDDEERVRVLLDEASLRQCLLAEPEVHVQVRPRRDWPPDTAQASGWELLAETPWAPAALDHLRRLFDIQMALLERLQAASRLAPIGHS